MTDEMRAILGRPYDTSVSFPIDKSDIRRWAIAVYYPERPPAEYIAGEVAPEEFNPFAWMPAERKGPGPDVTPIEVGREYHLAGATEQILGVQPPPLTHGLNGGIEIIYGDADMRAGDVITSTVSISEYSEREGRLGLMLFTTYDHVWTNQRGEHVKTQRLTYIRY
ncbi:MAG: MaoC family dehydratase N-terminal domain-containing protein [Acidimicrobiia bacterium]